MRNRAAVIFMVSIVDRCSLLCARAGGRKEDMVGVGGYDDVHSMYLLPMVSTFRAYGRSRRF